jgi:hypothetical protein
MMLRRLTWTASLLLISAGAPNAAPPRSSLITSEELTGHLADRERAQEGLELELTARSHSGEGTLPNPLVLSPSDFVFEQRIVSVVSRQRYRIECTFSETNENVEGLRGQVITHTWNGQEARLTAVGTHRDRPTQQTARIANEPPRDVTDLPHLNFCGWWVFAGPPLFGLTDLFERPGPIGPGFNDEARRYNALIEAIRHEPGGAAPRLCDDGTTEWIIPSPFLMHTDWVIRAVRRDGAIAVESIRQRCFASEEAFSTRDEARMFVQIAVTFDLDSPMLAGLPTRARQVTQGWPISTAPYWGVTTLELRRADKFEETLDAFLEPMTADAIVGDERYNIAYHLGRTELNVDGRLLETHVAMFGDVGARLAWWIEHGRWLDAGGDDDSRGASGAANQAVAPGKGG